MAAAVPCAQAPDPRPGTPPPSHQALRQAIAALERTDGGARSGVSAVSTGCAVIDAALPWGGLPCGHVHEIMAPDSSGAGLGFVAHLSAQFSIADRRDVMSRGNPCAVMSRGNPCAVIWCGRTDDLYAPGLAAFGLDPARLILAEARDTDTIAWILEEAAASGAPAAAVGMVSPGARGLGDTALRRLQLAAERGGVAVLLVRAEHGVADTRTQARGPVTTRWRVAPLAVPQADPGAALAAPVWQLDLVRCRGGRPARWTVQPVPESSLPSFSNSRTIDHDSALDRGPAAHRLAVVSAPGDGPPAPPAHTRVSRAAG